MLLCHVTLTTIVFFFFFVFVQTRVSISDTETFLVEPFKVLKQLHSVALSSCIVLEEAINEVTINGKFSSMKMETWYLSSCPNPAPIKTNRLTKSPDQIIGPPSSKQLTLDPKGQTSTTSTEIWLSSPWSPISHSSISLPSALVLFRHVQFIENEDNELEYLHATHPEAIKSGQGDIKPKVRLLRDLSLKHFTYPNFHDF